ncbi:MAG: hypothetical protein M0Z33_13760 [Actinomycetota bacterium]|nr:hypothetical protein [Actinomycetota bacterium]
MPPPTSADPPPGEGRSGASRAPSACPSVDNVLARADGGLVRIRVPGGRIGAAALLAVAEAAQRWGSGIVEITGRANLQLRGVRSEAAADLAEALVGAGVSGGPHADRRRNVLLDPLGDLDPEAEDLGPLLGPLLAALDAEPRLDGLDEKFGFAVDGGGSFGLAGRRAAVVATPTRTRGVMAVCWAWADDGEEGSPVRPRRVARSELVDALVEAAVDSLGRRRSSVAVPAASADSVARVAGPLGAGAGWVGAMPTLGRADAGEMVTLATAARRRSGGLLRLTPWRGVVLPAVASDESGALLEELRAGGLVVDAADPASTVVACAGSRGCTSALTDAVGDARRVIAARREAGSRPAALHVSGCAKCCAQQAPLATTLVGSGPGRYDVYAGGGLRARSVRGAEAVAIAAGS